MLNEKKFSNLPVNNYSKVTNQINKSKIVRDKPHINFDEENNNFINQIYQKPKTKNYHYKSLDNSINQDNDIELKYVTKKIPLYSDKNHYDYDNEGLLNHKKIRRNNSYDNRYNSNGSSFFDSNLVDNNLIENNNKNNINEKSIFGFNEKEIFLDNKNYFENKIKELGKEINQLKKENSILKTQNIEFKMRLNSNKKREVEENVKNKNLYENKLNEQFQMINQLKNEIKKKDNIILNLKKKKSNKICKIISFSIINKKRNQVIPKRNNSNNKLNFNNNTLKNHSKNILKVCSQIINFQLFEEKNNKSHNNTKNKFEDKFFDNSIFCPIENNQIYLERITFEKSQFSNNDNINIIDNILDSPNSQNNNLKKQLNINKENQENKKGRKVIQNSLINNNNSPINNNIIKKPHKEKTSLIMSVLNDDDFGLFGTQK